MRAEVVRPHELGAAELEAWRAMQRATPSLAGPFLAPEFTLAVGRVREDARVAVLREGHELVGFFPFQRGPLAAGRPIGAGVADVQALVHARGWAWEPRALLRACDLAVWEFDHLLAGQAPFARHHVTTAPSPVIDLAGGHAPWLAARRRASRRVEAALRKDRKLGRELGEVRFELDARDPGALHRVLAWKSAQYRRTGRYDRFARPWIARLVSDLVERRETGCAGTLAVLRAGDRLLAGHLGLRAGPVLASWFPAYDVAVAAYSPGLVLFLRLAAAAAQDGVGRIDLGKGDEEYKRSLRTRDLTVAEGWVQRRDVRAVVRAVRREPERRLTRFVLDRPALRMAARRARSEVGRLRVAVGRR